MGRHFRRCSHSRSSASTTTLCTETNEAAAASGWSLLTDRFGYGTIWSPFTSATMYSTGSPQRGKLTKIRPLLLTVTPVGIGPVNKATGSSWPTCGSCRSAVRTIALSSSWPIKPGVSSFDAHPLNKTPINTIAAMQLRRGLGLLISLIVKIREQGVAKVVPTTSGKVLKGHHVPRSQNVAGHRQSA